MQVVSRLHAAGLDAIALTYCHAQGNLYTVLQLSAFPVPNCQINNPWLQLLCGSLPICQIFLLQVPDAMFVADALTAFPLRDYTSRASYMVIVLPFAAWIQSSKLNRLFYCIIAYGEMELCLVKAELRSRVPCNFQAQEPPVTV